MNKTKRLKNKKIFLRAGYHFSKNVNCNLYEEKNIISAIEWFKKEYVKHQKELHSKGIIGHPSDRFVMNTLNKTFEDVTKTRRRLNEM